MQHALACALDAPALDSAVRGRVEDRSLELHQLRMQAAPAATQKAGSSDPAWRVWVRRQGFFHCRKFLLHGWSSLSGKRGERDDAGFDRGGAGARPFQSASWAPVPRIKS